MAVSSDNDVIISYQEIDQSMNVPDMCVWSNPPTCLAVPVSLLDWDIHGKQEYQVKLLIQSVTELHQTVTSESYIHFSGPPFRGIVLEHALGDAAEEGLVWLNTYSVHIYVKY